MKIKPTGIEGYIKAEIDALPKGTLVNKIIHGSSYVYLQWYENGKTRSRYLKGKDLFDALDVIELKDSLKSDLNVLKNNFSDRYYLMHQNTPVALFVIENRSGRFRRQLALYHPELLPIGVAIRHGAVDINDINEWFSHRIVPLTRDGIGELLEELGLPSPAGLALLSRGLNLVDQYWLRRVGDEAVYEEVNYFDHRFSDNVGDALLGNGIHGGNFHSPSVSTNGNLRKSWRSKGQKRYLLKSGSGTTKQEVFNEAAVSNILDALGVDHVHYDVTWLGDAPYSKCEGFVTRDMDFVDAWHLMKAVKKENDVSYYQHFLRCCDDFGIRDARDFLDRMIVVDFLIGNEDRHFGNFGALRDANTLEFIGMSPMYDNGSCLAFSSSFSQIRPGRKVPSKPFKPYHRQQLDLVRSFTWIKADTLPGLVDILRSSYQEAVDSNQMSPALVDAIVAEFQSRVEELLARMKKAA